MKFLLIFTLFLSFAGCPSLLAVIDDHHSVGFANEHGVPHLILFHAHNTNEDSSSKILTTATKEGNHEFHLSSSSALLKKPVQASFIAKNMLAASNHKIDLSMIETASSNLFEADIGNFRPPVLILRI